MSFNHITVQKNSSNKIMLALLVLFVIYLLSTVAFWAIIKGFGIFIGRMPKAFTVIEILIIVLISLIAVFLQFLSSESDRVRKTLKSISAYKYNPKDRYHNKFNNIVQEASIALGGIKFDAYIIDSLSINAFSLSDGEHFNVIGVTEAALAKFNRAQLEAVVAQCAAMITTGDSLVISKSVSMLGLITVFSKNIAEAELGGEIFYLHYKFFSFLNKMINRMLSIECFYKADALAVKLSNNPVALAQAFTIIGDSFAHDLLRYDGIEMVFIADLGVINKDKNSSSHPKLNKRIDNLLKMAKVDSSKLMSINALSINNLDGVESEDNVVDIFSYKENELWKGPFVLADILRMPWLTNDTEILNHSNNIVNPLTTFINKEEVIDDICSRSLSENLCPLCKVSMYNVDYEGAGILRCPSCLGYVVESKQLRKILRREDRSVSPRILSRAANIMSHASHVRTLNVDGSGALRITCPKCSLKMQRRLFAKYAPVEVDLCTWCELWWFDPDELEVIQVIYENTNEEDRRTYF